MLEQVIIIKQLEPDQSELPVLLTGPSQMYKLNFITEAGSKAQNNKTPGIPEEL